MSPDHVSAQQCITVVGLGNNTPVRILDDGFRSVTQAAFVTLSSDNPISRPEDDALGREALAATFADNMLSLDASEGLVVGVLGPWGSGKTSFLNLAGRHLTTAGAEVLDFNPWMFSGADQLVESFFVELAAQLKLKSGLKDVGERLGAYGQKFGRLNWLPVVGPWLERSGDAAKLLGELLKQRDESVIDRRDALHKALAELDKPIVVASTTSIGCQPGRSATSSNWSG